MIRKVSGAKPRGVMVYCSFRYVVSTVMPSGRMSAVKAGTGWRRYQKTWLGRSSKISAGSYSRRRRCPVSTVKRTPGPVTTAAGSATGRVAM